jgi:transcriptional regulator with XRE-family HTH domain
MAPVALVSNGLFCAAARSPLMPAKSADATDVLVGRNVRIRRLARGVSQSQLAKRLGVTFQQVQKYEKGINRIGSGRLARIAEVLRIPVAALFDGIEAGPQWDPASSLHLIADRRSYRLAVAFNVISDPVFRLSIVTLVEGLAAAAPRKPSRSRR